MKFEHVLLGVLAMRPQSGYDLRRWLEREGRFLRSGVHQSQVYRLLGRMTDQGWITWEADARDGAPDAKVYRLTDAGREALTAWAHSPYEPPSRFQDPEFVARLLFAGMLDADLPLRLIDTELDHRRAQVAHSRGRDRTLRLDQALPEIDAPRTRLLTELLHLEGVRQIDAWIDWLEHTRRLLTDHRDTEQDVGHDSEQGVRHDSEGGARPDSEGEARTGTEGDPA
ncbi:PadR family transcriptional regulator [Streptomyces sp. NPDC057694]|uniref:PadR family transcriptional regulator n=1 Tax=Streptomyces sp. NPDC057694 TaxID=3346216 RepID=UPI0036739D1C